MSGWLEAAKHAKWKTPKKQTYAALLSADDKRKYLTQEQREYFLFITGENYIKLLEDKPKNNKKETKTKRAETKRMVAWKESKDERIQWSKDIQKVAGRNAPGKQTGTQLGRKQQLRTLESDKVKFIGQRSKVRAVRFFKD